MLSLNHFRRVNTDSAKKWLHQMDESGVPVLLCLTHADKFYANECLKKHGKDCSKEIAKKLILQELEVVYILGHLLIFVRYAMYACL